MYVREKFAVKFHLFSKVNVNGENTHPIYKFLRSSSFYNDNKRGVKLVPFNFGKFFVNDEGKVVGFFTKEIEPEIIEKFIENVLDKNI